MAALRSVALLVRDEISCYTAPVEHGADRESGQSDHQNKPDRKTCERQIAARHPGEGAERSGLAPAHFFAERPRGVFGFATTGLFGSSQTPAIFLAPRMRPSRRS